MQDHLGLQIPPMGIGADIPVGPEPDFTATVISLGYGLTVDTRTNITLGYTTLA